MLLTTLLAAAILGADLDAPVSAVEAIDAAATDRLAEYFCEPELATKVLFDMPVARVNGRVVTAESILCRMYPYLSQIESRLSSDEYSRNVQHCLERELPNAVMYIAIEDVMVHDLSTGELAAARRRADRRWQIELRLLAEELGRTELSAPLPVSLEMMKEISLRKWMGSEYVLAKADLPRVDNVGELTAEEEAIIVKNRDAKVKDVIDRLMAKARIETAYTLPSARKAD